MSNLPERGMFSSAPSRTPFCLRTLLWLTLSAVQYPKFASARPTSEVLRRASDDNGSDGNSISASVWVRTILRRAPAPKACLNRRTKYLDTRIDTCSRRCRADTGWMRQAGHQQGSRRSRGGEHTCWSGCLNSPWKTPEARTDSKSDIHKIASTLHAGTGRPGACSLQVCILACPQHPHSFDIIDIIEHLRRRRTTTIL